jgi:DNA topoisomerase-2
MITPILRAKKGIQTKLFYNEQEYKLWKDSCADGTHGWTMKYFKGLGTSTSAEFKEYFEIRKIVDFKYSGQLSDDTIDKVFNKKRPDDRKVWLADYDKNAFLDTTVSSAFYETFIDDEMRAFSRYDNARSIPNGADGLKISTRKILFAAFKRKLIAEIKVAQFSGYVSEHSSYHHGEASLNGAIVNMAQNFVGSNNINILEPIGQFGTRLQGGDDSASERYIFTALSPITRLIFPEADDAVLNYLNDDGTMVEPDYYVPIIPFALINGISGIGTGFSSNIPPYNPVKLIEYLKLKLTGQSTDDIEFVPYFEGFKGTVLKTAEQKYMIKGLYEKISDDKIRITELPVGTWTMPYTTFLESLADGATMDKSGKKIAPSIKDFISLSTEVAVDFTVIFPKDKLSELEQTVDAMGINGVEKLLKLSTTISSTNMHMFNADCKLCKYDTVDEVIEHFYGIRMGLYAKRKAHLVTDMERKLMRLSNRARYIQETLNSAIDLRRKNGQQVVELLDSLQFDKIDGDFKYLIKMPMDSVTEENVANIMKEKETMEHELVVLRSRSLEDIWLCELDALESEYTKYKLKREHIQSGSITVPKIKIVKKKLLKK